MGQGIHSKTRGISGGQSIGVMDSMKIHTMISLTVDGHTCSVGSVPKNVLSTRDSTGSHVFSAMSGIHVCLEPASQQSNLNIIVVITESGNWIHRLTKHCKNGDR